MNDEHEVQERPDETEGLDILDSFPVPMSWKVLMIFFLLIALMTVTVAWSFRVGFTWSAICIIAVGLPLTLIFWYMLHVNPSRSRIELTEAGLLLHAPPFLRATIPFASIHRAFASELKDPAIKPGKIERGMRFGGYLSGSFELPNSQLAVILSNKRKVVVLDTADGYYLLGPARLDAFIEALGKWIPVKR